jgi:hypothetical protein
MKVRTLSESISNYDASLIMPPASPNKPTKFSNKMQQKRNTIAGRLLSIDSSSTLNTDPLSDLHCFSISFGSVTIREFRLIPGDNPSVTDKGPPLSIAWDHIKEESYDLPTYELLMKEEHRRPRSRFGLSPTTRVQRLRDQGNSKKEIRASARAADTAHKQREETMDESLTCGEGLPGIWGNNFEYERRKCLKRVWMAAAVR